MNKNMNLTGRQKIGAAIAGGAVVLGAGILCAVKGLKRNKKEEQLWETKGTFYAARNTYLRKEKIEDEELDAEGESIMVYKDRPLEGVIFEDGWFKIKVAGREGYLPKRDVYCMFEEGKEVPEEEEELKEE